MWLAVALLVDLFRRVVSGRPVVLDSGCGPGADTRSLAEAGLRPVALDLAASMALLAEAEVPGRVVPGDSRQLPFSDEAFDGVWANLSLLHLPNGEVGVALAEIRRVLRDGGVFCAGLQAGEDDGIEAGRPGSSMSALRYYARYRLPEWAGYLAAQGFETIDAVESETSIRSLVRKP